MYCVQLWENEKEIELHKFLYDITEYIICGLFILFVLVIFKIIM